MESPRSRKKRLTRERVRRHRQRQQNGDESRQEAAEVRARQRLKRTASQVERDRESDAQRQQRRRLERTNSGLERERNGATERIQIHRMQRTASTIQREHIQDAQRQQRRRLHRTESAENRQRQVDAARHRQVRRQQNEIVQDMQQRRAEFLANFNAAQDGELIEQPWVIEEIKKFHQHMEKYNCGHCSICKELWPTLDGNWSADDYVCSQCKKNRTKYPTLLCLCFHCAHYDRFSAENDMVRTGVVPDHIKRLLREMTMIEEMLLSPVIPIMTLYRINGLGRRVARGFCVNFRQNVQAFAKELPRLPRDLPVLIVRRRGQENTTKECVVDRRRVETLARWAKENNPDWLQLGCQVSLANLRQLPDHGVPDDLPSQEEDEDLPEDDANGPQPVTPGKSN